MHLLSVEGISKAYADKTLLSDVTFHLSVRDKVALVARNGSGKTTLLRIIMGQDTPDNGSIYIHRDCRVGYLGQEPQFHSHLTVWETVYNGDSPAVMAIRKYEEVMATGNTDELEEAVALMDRHNAWDFESEAKQILGKLQLDKSEVKVERLSGGQIKRLALAKILLEKPTLLILDEPTNHLDLEMIEWLEQFLAKPEFTLLMVTHDRYFLENVCDTILELSDGVIHRYKGNYAYFLQRKEERDLSEAASVARAKNLMRKELDWIRRQPKARGTKSKARIDAFYELKSKAGKKLGDEQVEIQININRLGSKVVEFHHVHKAFDSLQIMKDFNYKFITGEKVGIVGKNGSGKTTFLKMLQGIEQPDAGKIVKGDTVKFGYYSQSGLVLKEDMRVVEVVRDVAEVIPLKGGKQLTALQLLEMFLFDSNQRFTYVSQLSGGEKKRLFLLTVLMRNPNFLILDEPTNDLDIATLQVLEDFLQDYQGCVMIVSHDRYFLDKIVDHLFVIEGGGIIRDFPGNYSDYREFYELIKEADKSPIESEPEPLVQKQDIKQKRKLSFKEQKEFETLEREIAELEAKQIEFTGLLSTPVAGLNVQKVGNDLADITFQLESKMSRWLELGNLS